MITREASAVVKTVKIDIKCQRTGLIYTEFVKNSPFIKRQLTFSSNIFPILKTSLGRKLGEQHHFKFLHLSNEWFVDFMLKFFAIKIHEHFRIWRRRRELKSVKAREEVKDTFSNLACFVTLWTWFWFKNLRMKKKKNKNNIDPSFSKRFQSLIFPRKRRTLFVPHNVIVAGKSVFHQSVIIIWKMGNDCLCDQVEKVVKCEEENLSPYF